MCKALISDGIPARTGIPAFPFDSALMGMLSNFMGINMATVRPIDVVGNINAPMFYMHGTADIIIPYEHSETLAAASQNARTWIVEGVGHSLIFWRYPDEWRNRMLAFLDDIYSTTDSN